jgi:hypothetical protein
MENLVSDSTQHPIVGDPALAEVASEVQAAQGAIRAALRENPDREWRPSELISVARESLSDSISNTSFSIAFWNLVEANEISVDEEMTVREAAQLVA